MTKEEYKQAYLTWKKNQPEKEIEYIERYAKLVTDMLLGGAFDNALIMTDSMCAVFDTLTEELAKGVLAVVIEEPGPTKKSNIEYN